MKLFTALTITFCFALFPCFAYGPTGLIRGRVLTHDGKPAAEVTLLLRETNKGTTSTEDGFFALGQLPAGTYTLVASHVGLQTVEKTIQIGEGLVYEIELVLFENARQLQEVQIRTTRSLNERPLGIGKVNIRPMDLPQSTLVVDRGVLERQQALRLSDVLANTSGIYQFGNTGGYQEEIGGRGFSYGSSNTFKNGVRFNNAIMPELSALERVEILKGSNAILFGNVAAGGVLNLVTRKPRFEPAAQASLRVGSFGFFKPSFDLTGAVGGSQRVAYRVNTTYEKANSFRDGVKSERYYINPSLLFKLDPKTELLVEADYLTDNRTPDFGTGAVNYTIADVPRNRFLGVSWGYYRAMQQSLTVTLTRQLNQNWQVRVVGSLQKFDSDLFTNQRPNANSQFIQTSGKWIRGLQRTQVDETYRVAQADLTGQLKTGSIGHTLLFGADTDSYRTQTTAFNPMAKYDSINIFNPELYRQRNDIPELTRRTVTNAPVDRFGIYAQDLISLSGKLKVLAGVRYSYQQTVSNVLTVADSKTTSVSNYDDAFTPRLGVVFQPIPTVSFFGSYASSFVLNTGVDVNNNALPPSTFRQYEAGWKNELFNGRLSANVTVYQIDNDNLAQTSLANNNTNTNIKELAGAVRSRGLEVDVMSKPMGGWSLVAGYAYNKTWYVRSNTYVVGSLLRYNPQHTANASAYYQFGGKLKNFNAGLTTFYVGERVAGRSTRVTVKNDAFRLMPVPDFVQFDASAGYSNGPFSVRLKVSNLLNQLSYYVHDDNSVNPIAPRMVSATVAVKW